MANSCTERVVLSQQLITCLRELASLAQRSADIFHELGDSVLAVDVTLNRLSARTIELDRKVGELRNVQDDETPLVSDIAWGATPQYLSLRHPLAPISESPPPNQYHPEIETSQDLFSPESRPIQERQLYAAIIPHDAPIPTFVPFVGSPRIHEESEEDVMKRGHEISIESVTSISDKSTSGVSGVSRRSSWRDSFRLPTKRRRRQAAAASTCSTGRSGDRPRSVDFSHRHTVHSPFYDSGMSVTALPSSIGSAGPSTSSMMDYELERRQVMANGGVRRQHAKSIGEVPSATVGHQGLDDHVISALVERTLHLSGHLDYDLHRPQSSHFSTLATSTNGGGVVATGPSERSQSCNGLLEQDDDGESHRRQYYPGAHMPPVPMPPPRQGSLLRASSMPMSPDLVIAGMGNTPAGASSGSETPKLKRSMSISQRARALFRPASSRRSRSRSKDGHLAEGQEGTGTRPEDLNKSTEQMLYTTPNTDNVERRRKTRGRSKSPISWLLSRINPPGQQANQPSQHQAPRPSVRAVSCVESVLTVTPIDTGEDSDVFATPVRPRTPSAASSMAQLFRRRSRSREKAQSPKKTLPGAEAALPTGPRLAGHFRPGSRSPGDCFAANSFHRFRADSDDVDYYVRRHIIDFPSQDADDFHVDFSRLATLRLRREGLIASSAASHGLHPIGGPGPEPAVPLAHVRHFLQSGRDLMNRRNRSRQSRRQTDRYSADATPSTPGPGSEITPMPSPGIVRMQAVRPSSLTFKHPTGPPPTGPTSPRLRTVTTSGVAGVGSLAEQLDKLSSQFCNAVSLRRGYKGSGSRSSSGHWSVSTSSLHPKRSSYMSTVGQPTSPLSTISAALPGPTLPRSVSKDSALDSSSPCERPASELVNVASRRSVEVQTDPKGNLSMQQTMENMSIHGGQCDDDVFCRSSAETLSSIPPAPPPRTASLRRPIGTEVDNTLYQTKMSPNEFGDGYAVPQRSRPTTPGRSAESNRQPLPVTLPYRSGTLPRNLKSRLKGGTDTLKRLENSYRSPDDYTDHTGTGDTDSDSYSERRTSSSASEIAPLDTVGDAPPTMSTDLSTLPHYAVVDLSRCSPHPTSHPLHMKQDDVFQRHQIHRQQTESELLMKAAVAVDQVGQHLLPYPHHLRSPHLSSNSHLSSFSGDSDTGSSCSGPNPYQRLYSLSNRPRSSQERGSGDNFDNGRAKYIRSRRLLQESSG